MPTISPIMTSSNELLLLRWAGSVCDTQVTVSLPALVSVSLPLSQGSAGSKHAALGDNQLAEGLQCKTGLHSRDRCEHAGRGLSTAPLWAGCCRQCRGEKFVILKLKFCLCLRISESKQVEVARMSRVRSNTWSSSVKHFENSSSCISTQVGAVSL